MSFRQIDIKHSYVSYGDENIAKAKQQRSVTAADYTTQIKEFSQQMQELEARQAELQTTENRCAEVRMWLDSFA